MIEPGEGAEEETKPPQDGTGGGSPNIPDPPD